ncbi:MAG: succinylglutamate desuccinylase/aspartoacylase family protein [Bacteroidota bacterium]|jgi:predicted deacylase
MKKGFKINDQAVAPGENRKVILNRYELPTNSNVEIPVHVFRSKIDGPIVLLSAGMHGDETNGIEIIRKIISRAEISNLKCGTVIAIPVINIVSFLFGSRDLPDGRDMNRCFPGKSKGSLGSRIAHDLMKQIVPLIDFGFDFHTGGSKINNHPQMRCVFEFSDSLKLAEVFSPPLIINSSYRDGTFRREAAKKGKPILVFEGGESLRFDYLSINEGVNGILRTLHHYGMIEVDVPNNPSVKLLKDYWVRADESGLFHASVPNGSHVREGDLVGVICNPYGSIDQKLLAPKSGWVVGINNQPVVHQGDALIHIGMEDA